MLSHDDQQRVLRNVSLYWADDGFDEDSRTLDGPYEVVGDCISEHSTLAMAWIDVLPVRAGDLGLWFMPSLPVGEQYSCKWLLQDSAGRAWLACKYFAVRYRPDFHRAAGRIVKIVRGDPGTFNPSLAQRLRGEMLSLREAPPQRDDVVVFESDLLDRMAIVAALDRAREP